MKLNRVQKEWLLKESGMFEPYDIYKIFDSININWVIDQDIEIIPGYNDWWDLLMNGSKYTSLNFAVYPEVLEELKNIK